MPNRIYDYDTFPSDPQVGDVLNLCFDYVGGRPYLYDMDYLDGENMRLTCIAADGDCATYELKEPRRQLTIRLGPKVDDNPSGKVHWIRYCALKDGYDGPLVPPPAATGVWAFDSGRDFYEMGSDHA